MKDNRIGILYADQLESGLTHEFFAKVLDSFKSFCEQEGFIISFLNAQPKYIMTHTFVDQVKEDEYAGVFIRYARSGCIVQVRYSCSQH